MSELKVKQTCVICGRVFDLGWDGTVDGCDKCTGVRRDRGGNAWYPQENIQTRQSVASDGATAGGGMGDEIY